MATGVVAIVAACGSASGTVPPRAVVDGRFDTQAPTSCSIAGSQVRYGLFRAADNVPLKDGSRGENGTNHVTCRVVDVGGGNFEVEGEMRNDARLIFSIEGTFPKTAGASGFKIDRSSTSNGLVGASFAVVTESDGQCTARYATKDQGVSAGHVWAEVTCPNATSDASEGGGVSGSCVTITQFLFDDCATN